MENETFKHDSLSGIEKTMLMPLWGRCSESIKPDGILKDKKCVQAAQNAGIDFSEMEKSHHPASRLAWVARAWNTDLELKRLVKGEATVVCIGCGLETAFFRNSGLYLNWYDIDLPEVIALRRRLIGDSKGCVMIPGSALEADTYSGIRVEGRLIVLALGLLCYFTADEVSRIFSHIAALSDEAYALIDYFSARGAEISNAVVLKNCSGAEMRWSADSPEEIEALHPAARVAEAYPLFKKTMSLLSPQDKKLAAASDAVPVESMAVIKFG